jgi:LysR family transcriptional regulator, hydrogen peroxide-inducible genes activator
VELFSRNRRNVALTPAGENLLEHGRTIFRLLEEAETAAKTAKDPYSGKLAFGCASTTLLYHLPSILMEYTQTYPNVELKITGGTIQEIGTQMWSGGLDLALVVLPFNSPALETSVGPESSFEDLRSGVGTIHSSPPRTEHKKADRPVSVQREDHATGRHRTG